MDRAPLLRKIADYRLRFPAEKDCIEKFCDFVRLNENCFDRNLAEGHLTGSAWIVSADRKRVLLTLHKKLNKWVQPGGHADMETDLLTVAFREACEETGLGGITVVDPAIFDLDIHVIPARGNCAEHSHYDVRFAFSVTGDEKFVVSDESHELRWISIAEISLLTNDESIQRMADKWLRYEEAAK
jgi:8-oxo-dGTP pyrophosphatase MutT (NUDIX family)